MTEERREKDLRSHARRASDARGGRPTGRAFRPLRWAWLLLLVALLAPAYDLFLPAGYRPLRERRTVVIEHGQTLHDIALELQRVGVIRSQLGFLVLARAMQLDRSVKAGQYSFRMGITVPALLRALDRGMYGLNLVTVPEGLMVSEAATLIERQVGISALAIESLARDPMLLDSLGIGAPSLEGWLAPDSYEWLPGTSPEIVLRTMVSRTRERVQHATAGYDSLPLGMNAHEVLTLASIVESESRAREERPHIARVYLNRLERGMLLQADPTVGYALGRGPRSKLTFKDLRVVSPYNTYRHEGLPPGPICSPGLAAIEAVMTATPGVHDLYFVARGQGHHMFAPTYEQHLANIAFVRGNKAAQAARNNPDAGSEAGPDPGENIEPGAALVTAPPVAAGPHVPDANPLPAAAAPTHAAGAEGAPLAAGPQLPATGAPAPPSIAGPRLPDATSATSVPETRSAKHVPGSLASAAATHVVKDAAPVQALHLQQHTIIQAAASAPPPETLVPPVTHVRHVAAADSAKGAAVRPATAKPATGKAAADTAKSSASKTVAPVNKPAAIKAVPDSVKVAVKKAVAPGSTSTPAAKPAATTTAKKPAVTAGAADTTRAAHKPPAAAKHPAAPKDSVGH